MKRLIATAALAGILVMVGCSAPSGKVASAGLSGQASSAAELPASSASAIASSPDAGASVASLSTGSQGTLCAIEAPAPEGQAGEWRTDDPATQENNIVKLVSSGIEGDAFVARYEPVNDGTTTVNLKHYQGPACDTLYTYVLSVENGQIKVKGKPTVTQAPSENALDQFLSGDWIDGEKQFTELHIQKNSDGGWRAEAISPATHSAHVVQMTLYYDCDLQKLVYTDGAMYDLPISDSEDEELGDPVATGEEGVIEITSNDEGKVALFWNSEANFEGYDITFARSDGKEADYAELQQILSSDSDVPSEAADAESADGDGADIPEGDGTAAAASGADGQNPVMNFVGPYACDRASMKVEASGSADARVTISWGSSASEASEWVMSGLFDPDTLTVNYSNAVKTNYVYNSDGSIASQEVEYSDGYGRFVFHDGKSLSCTWQNENEPDNGAMTFTWSF